MERKPAARMESRAAEFPVPVPESRTPHSIRFTPSEWDSITVSALSRGLEPSVFVRMLAMYALSIVQAPVVREASLGMPSEMLSASRGIRRF